MVLVVILVVILAVAETIFHLLELLRYLLLKLRDSICQCQANLLFLKQHADVQRLYGMRQRADRNEIHAGLGNGPHAF